MTLRLPRHRESAPKDTCKKKSILRYIPVQGYNDINKVYLIRMHDVSAGTGVYRCEI